MIAMKGPFDLAREDIAVYAQYTLFRRLLGAFTKHINHARLRSLIRHCTFIVFDIVCGMMSMNAIKKHEKKSWLL